MLPLVPIQALKRKLLQLEGQGSYHHWGSQVLRGFTGLLDLILWTVRLCV